MASRTEGKHYIAASYTAIRRASKSANVKTVLRNHSFEVRPNTEECLVASPLKDAAPPDSPVLLESNALQSMGVS